MKSCLLAIAAAVFLVAPLAIGAPPPAERSSQPSRPGVAAADEGPQPDEAAPAQKSSVIMRRKLEHSQKILEGLANEDFEMIEKNARIMNTFTQLEKWYHAGEPQYKAQLNIFLFANDEIVRQARDKNLDGAALAYTQLTLSCVNCHKYVRGAAKK